MAEVDTTAPGEVVALLGATNTGKTHRAIEQMLGHRSGMLGLPLRLLAREVYDRVTARVGEREVALVTGEEKRVPRSPRFWICTVEAMPRDVSVDFLGIDEVQLVAHPQRGHVFTERVLDWRGARETWLLGSPVAESVLRALVPELRVERLARLSRLTHLGVRSLRSLPRRSAVVTFTVDEVYRLADVLRQRKGGAAVVVGLLSPRARNAQVAMYEAGEVDHLVATDAIGMGLNLDVDHVAMASLEKFDGFAHRPLDPQELGQIVGRAGRHLRDGTFGTLTPLPPLSPGLVGALEGHRFAPLEHAYYRNAALCFDTPEALVASLGERPAGRPLRRAPEVDDVLALRALLRVPEVLQRARGSEAVQLLWDVCHVPNYEGHIPEHHAQLLAQVYARLCDDGVLPEAWLEARLRRLERLDGDLHELTARVCAVRTWAYLVHQASWVQHSGPLRARTRELEERLSDALHERLRERFVERRSGPARASRGGSDKARRAPAGPFAALSTHALYIDAERQVEREEEAWVEGLVGALHEDFRLDSAGVVSWRGAEVARLLPGSDLAHPALRPALPEWLGGGMRRRVERRLSAYARDLTGELLDPLARAGSPALGGLLYQLRAGLGSVAVGVARPQLEALEATDRELLAERGVVAGRRVVYAQHALTSARVVLRSVLVRLVGRVERGVALPTGEPLLAAPPRLAADVALTVGYAVADRHWLRCDVLETLLALPADAGDRAQRASRLLEVPVAQADEVMASLARRRRRARRRGARRG